MILRQKRTLTLVLTLAGAQTACTPASWCEYERDLYASAADCAADWGDSTLECETFLDASGTKLAAFGPAYPKQQRPSQIGTHSGTRHVTNTAVGRQAIEMRASSKVSYVDHNNEIARGGFSGCARGGGSSS